MIDESVFIEELKNSKHRDKAFKKLLDLYQKRLYFHIRKLVSSHDDANDVLQNTFIRIYKGLRNFNQKSSLHTWMYRIAYNESMRFIEKNKGRYHYSIEDVSEKYLDNLQEDVFFEGAEIQLKLQKVILEMSEKQRKVFQMKYFDDLKFREISSILNINEGTLKSTYYSAVRHIEENIHSI